MRPEYPDWIPQCATEWDLEAFGARDCLDAKNLDVVDRYNPAFARALNLLISDFRTAKVWQAIAKRVNEDELRGFLGSFVHVIADGGIDGPSKFWELTPRKARNDHFQEIIETANKVISLLEELEYPIESLNSYQLIYKHPWFENPVRESNINNYAEYWSREDWVETDLKKEWTSLSTEEHMKDLIEYMHNLNNVNSYLVKVPKDRDTAQLIYFIRRLHKYFYENFDSPLDGTVAILANVFFHCEDIDRDKVKSYRRNRKYPSSDDSAKKYGYFEVQSD